MINIEKLESLITKESIEDFKKSGCRTVTYLEGPYNSGYKQQLIDNGFDVIQIISHTDDNGLEFTEYRLK